MPFSQYPQYPAELMVEGRRCLVVGGGRVAARKVDLSIELQILSFYQQRRMGQAIGSDAVSELAGL